MSLAELFLGFKASTKARHPEVFVQTANDPWKRQRTNPMQVLSLGMPRTGTASQETSLPGLDEYHDAGGSRTCPQRGASSAYADKGTKGRPQEPMSQPGRQHYQQLRITKSTRQVAQRKASLAFVPHLCPKSLSPHATKLGGVLADRTGCMGLLCL